VGGGEGKDSYFAGETDNDDVRGGAIERDMTNRIEWDEHGEKVNEKIMGKINSLIKSKRWFFGVRRQDDLFSYSASYWLRARLAGANGFVETILFPRRKKYLVRLFNLNDAKAFHRRSEKIILDNPGVLLKDIGEEYKIWKRIFKLCASLSENIERGDLDASQKVFLTLIEECGVGGASFFKIFSQGMMLEKNKDKAMGGAQRIKKILEKHNQWRNSRRFKEVKLRKAYYDFIKLFIKQKKLNIRPKGVFENLTASEVVGMVNGSCRLSLVKKKILRRKKHDYIYLYLKNRAGQDVVIDDSRLVNPLRRHFASLENQKSSSMEENIHGYVACQVRDKISGAVIVVSDEKALTRLKPNLENKILVTRQTSPYFFPYLRGVKAIITDEGGITSHAAIISREMEIPCIIGTRIATKVLKTGQPVEMDLVCGTVRMLGDGTNRTK